MPRPTPTAARRKLDSDELIVQPYMRAIMVVCCIAAAVAGATFVLASDATTVTIATACIVLLTANVIGYILVLAKQVEFVHRLNSRMDELLESTGMNEYQAGMKQGRKDRNEEIDN